VRRDQVKHLGEIKASLWQKLSALSGVRVNGPLPGEEDAAPHILSVSFEGVRGEVMRNALEGAGILVSTGSACASHKQKVSETLRAMGLTGEQADGTVRISLGLYNTMEEMEEVAAQMQKMHALLARYRRR
jgi:cysteine desulfurase